jgi:hypothetical protein
MVSQLLRYTSGHLMKNHLLCLLALTVLGVGVWHPLRAQSANPNDMATAQEKHLRSVRQLTYGGQNAEAYFLGRWKEVDLSVFAWRRKVRPDLHHEH